MPIIKIPVEFEYEGISFQGEFSTSQGSENVWHLMLYKYYYGQLVKYHTGWKWCGNNAMFSEPFMLEYFVRVVTAKN